MRNPAGGISFQCFIRLVFAVHTDARTLSEPVHSNNYIFAPEIGAPPQQTRLTILTL